MKYTNESSWMCLLVSLFQRSCTRRGQVVKYRDQSRQPSVRPRGPVRDGPSPPVPCPACAPLPGLSVQCITVTVPARPLHTPHPTWARCWAQNQPSAQGHTDQVPPSLSKPSPRRETDKPSNQAGPAGPGKPPRRPTWASNQTRGLLEGDRGTRPRPGLGTTVPWDLRFSHKPVPSSGSVCSSSRSPYCQKRGAITIHV